MNKGTVKWFNRKAGYGFITADNEKDYFVHYSGIAKEGYKSLENGDRVQFELIPADKGSQAVNVTVVQ